MTDFANDGSGNIVLVGSTTVSGQGNNFYAQKMSNSLVTAWTYTWNGAASGNDVAKAVEIDASGNVYMAGYSTNATLGKELTLIKLNSSGSYQWVQTSGFAGDDEANDLVIDASNDIYTTGYKTNNDQDYYTAKYNASGTKLWEIEMDGSHGGQIDYATNMTLDSLNNVIVTGQSGTSPSTFDFLTVKYVQRDVITPTDFNGEAVSNNFRYYTNKGQLIGTNDSVVNDVKFYTHNTYPSFYFKNKTQSFVFSRIDTVAATNDTLQRIDLDFHDCMESAETYAMDPQADGYLNYFLAHTDSNGVTGIKGNERLITPNLYPNIDLMCSSNQNGIKYYFIIKPGGDIRDIQMEFTGASSFTLDGTSNALSINSSIGSLTFDRPTAYQLTTGNATVAVTGWTPDWQTNGASNKYKFNDGAYTSSLTLVVEVDQGNDDTSYVSQGNLCWSTYIGGQDFDEARAIAKDNAGNQYIAGQTMSPYNTFPITNGSFQSNLIGEVGGFYSKFNTFNGLSYSTYYSGCPSVGAYTCFYDIKCKNSNEIVVAGYTTCNDAATMIKSLSSAYNDNSYNGGSRTGLIARFDGSGNRVWATYLGGANSNIKAMDFDASGNLYIGGNTDASNFALTATPNYNQSFGGGTGSDAFLAKLDNNYALSWSTFIGGNGTDELNAIKIDNSNRVIIFGSTLSSDFPTYSTGSAFIDNSLGGTADYFIGVFSSSAQRLWLSYLGGSAEEGGASSAGLNNIACNASSIFAVGTTPSSNFPLHNPGGIAHYDNSLSANSFLGYAIGDGYIVEFDLSTFQQKWGTLISGNGESNFIAADIDSHGNLFVAGSTGDHSITLKNATGAYNQSTYYGGATWGNPDFKEDGILFNFKAGTRELMWSTLIGGYNDHPSGDIICDMMILNTDEIYITGYTSSKNNPGFGFFPMADPATGNYFDDSFNGSFDDAFITKFCYTNIVGIKEINNTVHQQLLVYPNPVTNQLTISLYNQKFMGNLTIVIYSSNGQEVYKTDNKSSSNSIEINTADFAEGMYLIKVTDKENTYTTKFIKQ